MSSTRGGDGALPEEDEILIFSSEPAEIAMSDRQTLFRAICANPDDDEARLVFADLLEEQGDPERAEFIRLQIRVEPTDVMGWDEHRDYMLRIRHLENKHRAEWLDGLPEFPGISYSTHFSRGFIESLHVEDASALTDHADELFSAAPIRQLCFDKGLSKKDASILVGVADLARVRSLWFERYIRLSAESLRQLASSPHLAEVKELQLPDIYLSKELLRVVQRAAWRLEVLSLGTEYSISIDPSGLLASVAVERLTDLDLEYRHTRSAAAVAIAGNSRMTKLKRLNLTGCDIDDSGATALAGAAHLMNLATLNLANNNITSKGAKALAGAPWFAGLKNLGLDHNPIGPAGLRALLVAPRLPELKTLDLADCKLIPGSVVALAESPVLDGVQVLHLNNNKIGTEGVAALTKKGRLPCLQLLFITGRASELPESEVKRLKRRFGAKKVI
jgi:uncharacterized protein (TIGR02996 family)